MSKWNLINFFSHEHNCFWHHLHQTRSLIIQTIFVISTIFFNVLTHFMKKNMSANKVFFHVIKTSVFRESLFFTEHISFIRFFRISSTSSFFLIVSQGQLQKGQKVLWFVKTPGEWRALNDVFEIGVHPTFCECLAESWSKVSTN